MAVAAQGRHITTRTKPCQHEQAEATNLLVPPPESAGAAPENGASADRNPSHREGSEQPPEESVEQIERGGEVDQ
jgi:hypothetical protein